MLNNYNISVEKEKETDIKIIDTIYSNIKSHKLFLTQDHPTSFVFNNLTKQISDILDLEYNYESAQIVDENITGLRDSIYHKENNQYPISQYAQKYFNFEYTNINESTEDIEIDKQIENKDTNNFYKDIVIDYYFKNI